MPIYTFKCATCSRRWDDLVAMGTTSLACACGAEGVASGVYRTRAIGANQAELDRYSEALLSSAERNATGGFKSLAAVQAHEREHGLVRNDGTAERLMEAEARDYDRTHARLFQDSGPGGIFEYERELDIREEVPEWTNGQYTNWRNATDAVERQLTAADYAAIQPLDSPRDSGAGG